MSDKTVAVPVHDIFELICCAEDYGFQDDVLMGVFATWLGPLSNETIEAYAISFRDPDLVAKGFTEEDVEQARERLHEFRRKWLKF